MSTGRVRITLILAVLALGTGCASQPQAILSAAELESMIRIEVRSIEPVESDTIIAANDQP